MEAWWYLGASLTPARSPTSPSRRSHGPYQGYPPPGCGTRLSAQGKGRWRSSNHGYKVGRCSASKTGHWCRGPYIQWGLYRIVHRIPPYIEPYRIDIYDTPQNAAGSLAFGQTALCASRQPDWKFRYQAILFRFSPVLSLFCCNQQTIRLTTH